MRRGCVNPLLICMAGRRGRLKHFECELLTGNWQPVLTELLESG